MTEKHGKNTDNKPQRDARGRFIVGNSGSGIGGRPKQNPEAKEILKAATPDAARVLVELLNSKNEKIKFQAAQAILDRTQGKPETMNKVEFSDVSKNKYLIQWIPTQLTQEAQSATQTAN